MWKYGKVYILIQILVFGIIVIPMMTVLMVYEQRTVVDSLVAGKSLIYVLLVLLFFETSLFLLYALDNGFKGLFVDKKMTVIMARINKDIYEKAIRTDYKYFDNPDFYDNYTWAINEYSSNLKSTGVFKYLLGSYDKAVDGKVSIIKKYRLRRCIQ